MQAAPFLAPVRWGFVFLHCPLALTDEQRNGIVSLAVEAYIGDLGKLDFDWPYCRGEVRVASDAVAIGSFYGQRFTASVHLPDRSGQVEFLVTEAELRAARNEIPEA